MKTTKNLIAAIAISSILPVAAFAQAGAGTSGYPTGPGNPQATDIRTAGQSTAAVTTGTASVQASSTDHTGNQDSSGHIGTARNGVATTSGSGSADVVKPDGNH
jgi:hypothetical protein